MVPQYAVVGYVSKFTRLFFFFFLRVNFVSRAGRRYADIQHQSWARESGEHSHQWGFPGEQGQVSPGKILP